MTAWPAAGVRRRGSTTRSAQVCPDLLLKAVEGWTDLGLGQFELHYLRDKLKRRVDVLVVRNRKPWFAVEKKTTATAANHAFQV